MAPTGTPTEWGESRDQRIEKRKNVVHSGVLHYKGTQIPVVVQDLSRSGARLSLYPGRAGMVIDGPVTLEIPGVTRLPVTVRWQNKTMFGAAFELTPARKATLQQQIDRIMQRPGR